MSQDITRPIIGIENRSAQEVFDIMCDRFIASRTPNTEVDSEELNDLIERLSAGCANLGLHEDNSTELFDVEGANDTMAEAAAVLQRIRSALAEPERGEAAPVAWLNWDEVGKRWYPDLIRTDDPVLSEKASIPLFASPPSPFAGDDINNLCICQDCRRPYVTDMLVPDDIWETIKPEGADAGAGLLCPTCIMDRAADRLGWTVGFVYPERHGGAVTAGKSAAREVTDATRDVIAERRRQVDAEGWTPEHDDTHGNGEMAAAAACYAFQAAKSPHHILNLVWPWSLSWWKPSDKRRNLVKAGALVLAEIERLDRAALQDQPSKEG